MGVTVTEKDTYLYVKLEGETLTSQQIGETIASATERCKKEKKHALIHRVTVTKQIASMADFYGFSEYLENHWPRNQKIALVYPKSMLEDLIDFFEMASQNRGIIIKLFAKLADAESWLKELS